jgi:hypothetical protein
MKKRKGLYKYDGYLAFRVAAEAHHAILPTAECDGGSRTMGAIFRALDKAYTDGIEDALQLSDEELKRERRKIQPKHPDQDV